MIQGLNGNSIKNIDFQYLNNLNLPLDSRFYRYFTNVNSVPDNDNDYVGIIIFNRYDKQFYTCTNIENNGSKTYKKLMEAIAVADMYQLIVNDEDYSTVDSTLQTLNISLRILHLLPLNKIYYEGYMINTDSLYNFNDKSKIQTLPEKYRNNEKIIDVFTEDKHQLYNFENNSLYPKFDKFKSHNEQLNIKDKQVIFDESSTKIFHKKSDYIEVTRRHTEPIEISLGDNGYVLTNNQLITHNLKSTNVQVFLRYIFLSKEFTVKLIENYDYIHHDENAISYFNMRFSDNNQNLMKMSDIKMIIYGE